MLPKIIAAIASALLLSAINFKEIGDGVTAAIPTPVELKAKIKEWKQAGKEGEQAHRDDRKAVQAERARQQQEAVLRRQQERREAAIALQQRNDLRRQQIAEQRTYETVPVPPRQPVAVSRPVVPQERKAVARIRDVEDEENTSIRLASAPAVQCRHNAGGTIDLSGLLTCN